MGARRSRIKGLSVYAVLSGAKVRARGSGPLSGAGPPTSSHILSRCRAALRGAAEWGELEQRVVISTNNIAHKKFKMEGDFLKTRIGRLAWLQNMIKHGGAHVQILSTTLGHVICDVDLFLLRGASDPGRDENRKQHKGHADQTLDEDEYVDVGNMKAIVHQLGNRARTLKLAGMISVIMDRRHACAVECYSALQRYMTAQKEREGEQGAPACQRAFAVLDILSNYSCEENLPRRVACTHAIMEALTETEPKALRSVRASREDPSGEGAGGEAEARSLADLERRAAVYLGHIRRQLAQEKQACQRMFDSGPLYEDRPDPVEPPVDPADIDDSDEAIDAALARARGDWFRCAWRGCCRRRPPAEKAKVS
ncbi:unnamed protein product [Prorocentrum cordatum]|uniref:Uncharacterized protein n=1 Tax=Prorocentrum cordatum TaxID=2364126 RepID=A0ABN9RAD6_9DINO|nr:unnamed protein product [Polarella glacialis]